MPIYEFLCEACGEVFERITHGSPERPDCPACGSTDVSRQVSTFAARTSVQRRGGVVDLSSGCCPCGGGTRRHSHVH
ncbi:MAG: zinc ribbon domain-containing protein [Nitrospinota bacterium]